MVTSTGSRGSYAKTAMRREQIVDAAFEVFARVGYMNSTLAEIAAGASMTVPGITHHFPSRQLILEAVLKRRDREAGERMEGLEGLDALRGLLRIVERDQDDPELSRLFTILAAEATTEDHPAHEYFRRRYEVVVSSLVTAFREVKDARLLRDDVDAELAAQMFVALSDGLQLQRLHGVNAHSSLDVARAFVRGLLRDPNLL